MKNTEAKYTVRIVNTAKKEICSEFKARSIQAAGRIARHNFTELLYSPFSGLIGIMENHVFLEDKLVAVYRFEKGEIARQKA